MKQKLIYLFSLMLLSILGTSGALAETVTYALQKDDTFTSGQTVDVKDALNNVVATITYGEAGTGYADFKAAKANSSVSGFTAFTEGNGENGNKAGGTFYTIVPNSNGTIEIGVVINKDKTFIVEENGTSLPGYSQETEKLYGTKTFNVTAGKSYKCYVSGSKMGFYGFKFTPVATYTTVYNLATAIATTGNIEGTTGSLAPTTAEEEANAPDLQVDATNGKVGANGDWAQINENTVLTLPGVPEGATLTFDLYNTTALTIGGTAYTNGQTYTATADQDVVMTCTTGGYIKSITVEGTAFVEITPVTTYTTVYDIAQKLFDDDVTYQYNEGTVAPTTAEEEANAPDLQVDATNGKLGKNNADWAQINENTVLTLPGVPEGATLTFSLYSTTGLTIGETEYTNGQTYTATADQDVVMTCTTGGYIKSITVVGAAFIDATSGYTNTWYFGKSNGAPEFALQHSAEYNYESGGYSLVINTDAGKLNNASRTDQWAQCNDGTLFKVPVFAGSKLTWGRYNGGSTTGFNIDDNLYNEYYIANAEGTVNMSASGISYLSYIKIEPATLYEILGTISGGSIDGANVLLTATNGQTYEAEIASGAFTTSVPGGSYEVSLSGDVAYVVVSPENIDVTESGSVGTITIEAAQAQTVTGAITNAPAEAFTLTFTGNSHNAQVECEAGATSYSTTLEPDTYTISSSVGTLSTLSLESFKVVKDAATHNIYFPEVIPAATQQNITVDNTATVAANVYNTVSDALAAAKAGNISAPVITLTSGQTYREQVIVDMANVTLKTSGTEKAKITFYYGIGYCYYSLNSSGYYDKDRAMTRNSKLVKHPDRWGCTVKVTNKGNNFKAENIIFENSFNQYYTDEEVVDGVEAHPMGDTSITYDRTLTSSDAGYKAADAKAVTERAAAIAFENSPTGCEVYNCKFISSQDTYYTTGSVYAKNCDIQGNTDYIYGGGKAVFDNCNLVIGGYSDQETSAYVTAQKGNTGDAYIFRDCTITGTDRTYVKGNLGRDWGGASATVYYFNLQNEIGNKFEYKWSNMGGGVSEGTANLHIYDFDATVNANYSTTGPNGSNINGLLTDEQAVDLYAGVVSFLGFTPEHIYEDNLVLGESSAYNICRIAASDGVERTVELTRAITADKWATIVLPFAMTEAQLKSAFGENVKVAELTSGTESKLNFSYVTATEANKPYAIRVASTDSYSGSATIDGVTVADATPTQEDVDDWNFVGVYDVNVYMPVGSYFFTNNQIKKVVSEDTNKIKPFRAYFAYTGSNAQDNVDFSFDGEPTAIETLSEGDATQIEGKFIVDGQLVVAKNGKLYNAAGAVIK